MNENVDGNASNERQMISMISKANPEKDIRKYAMGRNPTVESLISDKSRQIRIISDQIGSEQVTRGKLAFSPLWILEQAFAEEYNSN